MNERIKLLAEQARKYYLTLPTGYSPDQVGMHRELMEKFAELIVRECVDIVEGYCETSPEIMGLPLEILDHFDLESDQ